MKAETKEKISKLEEALKAAKQNPPEETGALAVTDIGYAVESHLFASVKKALSTKVTEVKERDFEVRYLGLKAPQLETYAAGKKLAELVNEFCGAYQIKGQLGDFIKYDLAIVDSNPIPTALYLAYIAVTPEAAKIIDRLIKNESTKECYFTTGGMPTLELDPEDYETGLL